MVLSVRSASRGPRRSITRQPLRQKWSSTNKARVPETLLCTRAGPQPTTHRMPSHPALQPIHYTVICPAYVHHLQEHSASSYLVGTHAGYYLYYAIVHVATHPYTSRHPLRQRRPILKMPAEQVLFHHSIRKSSIMCTCGISRPYVYALNWTPESALN